MLFDTSILERVKKRLHGDQTQDIEADTQVIPDFRTSILFGKSSIEEDTDETQVSDNADHPRAIRLPQLPLDESDFYKPTQVIESNPAQDTLASTQVIPRPSEPDSVDLEGDVVLHNQKKPQEKTLAAELTHVSLTDEENDLNDDANTTVDSSVQKTVTNKAELQRIEKELSEQKRLKSIQPHFEKKAMNPMQKLLDAFESDSDDNIAVNSEQALHLSPNTSPALSKPIGNGLDSSDSESEVDDIMHFFDDDQKKPAAPKKKLSPIEEYAERLKKQLNSSPTSSKNDMIVLDESDPETDFEKHLKSSIPKLTKEQAFVLKQKFSKKHLQGKNANKSRFHKLMSLERGNALFNELRRANAKQLLDLKRNNPDSELIQEIEKEEEEMGNLLEREMERVRRIRKREKMMEKAQKALLDQKRDEDYDDAKQYSDVEGGSEVPDSDVDLEDFDSSNEVDSNVESEGEVGINQDHRVNRARRVVLSDDDDDENNEANAEGNGDANAQIDVSQVTNPHKSSIAAGLLTIVDERIDDSYMFGGPSKGICNDESEEPIMQIHSDMVRLDSPIDSAIDQDINNIQGDLHTLFSNLPPPSGTQESSMLEPAETIHQDSISFHDNVSTQKSVNDLSFLATQVDGPSLNGLSTQDDRVIPTQQDEYSDDEHDDVHSALDKGRRKIKENFRNAGIDQELAPEDIDEEDNTENNEEELKQRLAIYEAKIRRKELQARKLRKEMERKGLKGMVEGEAEESDDEWKGIGGLDREDSDQADSEDEKMIDNNFNIDLNDEEVRKKFMEQYQIKDRSELERLMDDIKNHRLTKRGRSNKFDIELSDEEDEILMAYRRQKLEEQKQRLLENQKMMQSTKSEKSKAFFDCIQEEPNAPILIDSESSDAASEEEKEDTPLQNSDDETKKKKTLILEESFVQKQLSFLSKTDEDEYMAIQRTSDFQHGAADDIEDVSVLKKRCLSSLYSRPGSSESLLVKVESRVDVPTDDDDEDSTRVFKKPSIVSSFRTYRDKNSAQISTNSFSGVTVNKQYKVASSSKASITYMSRQSKTKPAGTLSFKSSKIKEIEDRVDRAKLESGVLKSRNSFS